MESLEKADHQDPLVQDHQECRDYRDRLDHKDLSVLGVFLVHEVINMIIMTSATEHFLIAVNVYSAKHFLREDPQKRFSGVF